MIETQATVCAWADATFGPVSSNVRVCARANEEMAELLRAITANDLAKAPEEIADVVIVLYRLGRQVGAVIVIPADVTPTDTRDAEEIILDDAIWANYDMASLLRTLIVDPDSEHVVPELHRLIGSLADLAKTLGVDLQEQIDKKMKVNRFDRVWNLDGTGHGYHVRKKE